MQKTDYEEFASATSANAKSLLEKFIAKNANVFDFSELRTSGQWPHVWSSLFAFLLDASASHIYPECLSAIRILSRDKSVLDYTITNDQFNHLLNVANIGARNVKCDFSVQAEALKCLCNLTYNSTKCQQYCSKPTAVEGIIKRLRTYKDLSIPHEIQFFDMKLLFLITALNPSIRTKVRDDLHGLTYLVETLDIIILDQEPAESPRLSDNTLDLLCEILKVLFNLTLQTEVNSPREDSEEIQFRRVTTVLHNLFVCDGASQEKLTEMHSNIINMLTNIPSLCFSELVTSAERKATKIKCFEKHNVIVIDIMLQFLKQRLDSVENKVLQDDSVGILPILSALVKCVRCSGLLRRYIRKAILPPLRDVSQRPEVGTELRNQLCRLLTTPMFQVRDLVAELLFICCKENVNRMVKHTGFGNAAGLLANRGLLGARVDHSGNYSTDSEDSDTEEYKQIQGNINPVLGCYEKPRPNPLANMTEEQKEYEAMELVKLLDQLQRQGVVQPCKIGEDGRPEPVSNIFELQDQLPQQQIDIKRKV